MRRVFCFVFVVLGMLFASFADASDKFDFPLPVRSEPAEIELLSGRIIQNEEQLLMFFDEILNDEYMQKPLRTIEDVNEIAYNKIVYDGKPKEAIKVTFPEARLIKIEGKEYHLKNMVLVQYQYNPEAQKFANLYLGMEEIMPYKQTVSNKVWFQIYGVPSWAHRGRPLLFVFDLVVLCILTRVMYKFVRKEKDTIKRKWGRFIIKLILLYVFWYAIMFIVTVADSIRA